MGTPWYRPSISIGNSENARELPKLDLKSIMGNLPKDIENNTFIVNLDIKDNNMYVPQWQEMNYDNDGYPEALIIHNLSWTAIGLIVILLCITVYVIFVWLYRRRVKIKFFFADTLLAKLGARKECKKVKYSAKAQESVDIIDKDQDNVDVESIA